MKYILFSITIIACIAILLFSHLTYKDKLQTISSNAHETTLTSTSTDSEQPASPDQEIKEEQLQQGLIGKWASEKEITEPINIAFFGSVSLINEQEEDQSWPIITMQEIEAKSIHPEIEHNIINVGSSNSLDVMRDNYVDEVINSNPNILLFEPFVLNNNKEILIRDTLESIEMMLTELESALPDADIVLLPPNPLYNTIFYIEQVKELESLASNNGYLYANHWEAWPSTNDEELQSYLDEGRPNDQGHELWADYMVQFLTTEQ